MRGRRAYALPLVLVVMAFIAVLVGTLLSTYRASTERARLARGAFSAEGVAAGVLAGASLALADGVVEGATVLVNEGSASSLAAWSLARREGGNSCRVVPAPPTSYLRTHPQQSGISERDCFRGWLRCDDDACTAGPSYRVDQVRLSTTSRNTPRPAAQNDGPFATVASRRVGALVDVTVRDTRRDIAATAHGLVDVQVADASLFQLLALSDRVMVRGADLSGPTYATGALCVRGAVSATAPLSSARAQDDDDDDDDDDCDDNVDVDAAPVVRAVREPSPQAFLRAQPVPIARAMARASVSIIDGVWYRGWAGALLWSDHAGAAETTGDERFVVGAIRAVDGAPTVAGQPAPRRYSRYERDGSGIVVDDDHGVVSYGPVVRRDGRHTLAALNTAGDLVAATGAADTVAAARIGVVGDSGRKELPINIDLAELVAAIADRSPRELGDLLGSDGWRGVLAVSASWPGREGGEAQPESGSADDATQPPALRTSTATEQQALPAPLCATDRAGQPLADTFVVPRCDRARPRATLVRLINGRDLSQLPPVGLTVVSDLPIEIVGDLNVVPRADGGRPAVRVIGDRVTTLPASEDDRDRLWGATAPAHTSGRAVWHAHVIVGVPAAGVVDVDDVFGAAKAGAQVDLRGGLALLGPQVHAGPRDTHRARTASFQFASHAAAGGIDVVLGSTLTRVP